MPARFSAAETTIVRPIANDVYLCRSCGSRRLQAYQLIYDNYSSRSVTWKGLIFKHGYSVMSRKSLSAMKCAPPRVPNFWGPPCLLSICAAGYYLGASFMRTAVGHFCWMAGVVGCVWLLIEIIYRNCIYPSRRVRYRNSFLCNRCGETTMINLPVDGR